MSLTKTDLELIDSMLHKHIDAAAASIGKTLDKRAHAAKKQHETIAWEILGQINNYRLELEEERDK